MPVIKRTELNALLQDLENTKSQIYLFFGERYLCRECADLLQEALLKNVAGTVHPIDGDQEDHHKTLNQIVSFSLLPGLQIYRVTDSRIFVSKSVAPDIWQKARQAYDGQKTKAATRHLLQLVGMAANELSEGLSQIGEAEWEKAFGFTKPAGDLSWTDKLLSEAGPQPKPGSNASTGEKLVALLEKGLPENNILILAVETVDKRQKLFTSIKKLGQVIDCSVVTGASSNAQKVQKEVLRELVNKTLTDYRKQIEPRALEMLFERVGFQPVGLVMETEKLALYTEDRPKITCEDLERIVGRSREDALFELTDAFGKNQVDKTMVILSRLMDNGVHGLAILATMRNYIRKLLIFRSLQCKRHPEWRQGMQANFFQNTYLPALKESTEWAELLKGHPYALFMNFSKAAEFPVVLLKNYLFLLLQAEYRLKGSPLEQQLVLQELFLAMFLKRRRK